MRLGEEMLEDEHFNMFRVKKIDVIGYTGLAQLRKVKLRSHYEGGTSGNCVTSVLVHSRPRT